jgi:hypothetical protein
MLDDGYGQIIFEFDVAGDGVTTGTTTVDVSTDTTAADISATLTTAINGATHADGTAIRITATDATGSVTLAHDTAGIIGNQILTENVANANFTITNMTGGGGSYPLPTDHLALVGVDYLVSSTTGERRALVPLMTQERNYATSQSPGGEAWGYTVEGQFLRLYPWPASGDTYYHIYIPQAPDLVVAGDNAYVDVVTSAGESFLLWGVAAIILHKEEGDTRDALGHRDRALNRVVEWATKRFLTDPRRRVVADESDWGDREPGGYWNRPQ